LRSCPVCGSDKRKGEWRSRFLVPDGWTQPDYLDWFVCKCGMIYADNADITQRDYDIYYNEKYGYGVEDPGQQMRMDNRARLISNTLHDRNARIVDFGGGDGELKGHLEDYGFRDVHLVNAGDKMPENIDLLIAEHVLEHVYDMPEVMAKFDNVKIGGRLIVDVPDATVIAYTAAPEMPMLDFHQKHINHFSMRDMLRLMYEHGFEYQDGFAYKERFLSCRCYQFTKTAGMTYGLSKMTVTSNIEKKVMKLKLLGDIPVIVWGLGDIALHCLATHMPNVIELVDNDPAYRGAAIRGMEVKERPDSDAPIIILAQSQQKLLIENIRKMGITNEIEVI